MKDATGRTPPKTIPLDARCKYCGEGFKRNGEAVAVFEHKLNAPYVWYHIVCIALAKQERN